MEAGDTRAADLVDTVHRKMDSTVRSHCFYKSVQLRVIGKQVLLEKKPPANPHDEFAVRGSGERFSDSCPHSVGSYISRSRDNILHEGLCHALSGVCYITGKEKAQQDHLGIIIIVNT